MNLQRQQALQRARLLIVVRELRRHLPVELVRETIPLRDDRVFVPLGDVHLHRFALRDQPALTLRPRHHALPVRRHDATRPFLIEHRVDFRHGMNVALVAPDRPLADLRQFLAAILNAGVVPRDFHLRAQLEVLHHTAAPDEKLIVTQRLRPRRLPRDATLLNRSQRRIALPAGEVLAVEEGAKALRAGLRVGRGDGEQAAEKAAEEYVFHGVQIDLMRVSAV